MEGVDGVTDFREEGDDTCALNETMTSRVCALDDEDIWADLFDHFHSIFYTAYLNPDLRRGRSGSTCFCPLHEGCC